jgi:hypothetical protein
MKKGWLLIFLLFAVSASAQDLNKARADLEMLASPTFAGRGYVKMGGEKAARYIAKRFEELEMRAPGQDYFQAYPFEVNTFPRPSKLIFEGKALREGYDYIIDPRSGKSQGKFAVQRMDSTDFSGRANPAVPEDKVPLIFTRGIDSPEEVGLMHEFTQKALVQGPVLLVRPDKLTWSVGQRLYPNAIFEILEEAVPEGEISRVQLSTTPESIPYRAANVAAMIKGERSDSLLVLTAHYDHLGMMGDALFPGASDNASGTAMLLDLARHYSENQPEYDTWFIAFSGEEAGLIGSRYFVDHPLFDLKKVRMLINLDLMGSAEKGITVVNGRLYEDRMKELAAINVEGDFVPKVKLRGKAANSDHYWFSEAGVPAIFIYTEGNITAYHDVHDTPAVVDWANYEEVFTLLVEFIKTF